MHNYLNVFLFIWLIFLICFCIKVLSQSSRTLDSVHYYSVHLSSCFPPMSHWIFYIVQEITSARNKPPFFFFFFLFPGGPISCLKFPEHLDGILCMHTLKEIDLLVCLILPSFLKKCHAWYMLFGHLSLWFMIWLDRRNLTVDCHYFPR